MRVPPTYYRPRTRATTGSYDDTIFVAADYAAGRTASVSRTDAARLLTESGDPLPLYAGQISGLKDLGKPQLLAKLLIGRRDGDPRGLQPSRSELRAVDRLPDGSLSFTFLTITTSATSLTTAQPGARLTVARTVFDASGADGPSLVTAWASSTARGAACEEVPCPPCDSLRCECPPPKCTMSDGSFIGNDPLDAAIVASLTTAR